MVVGFLDFGLNVTFSFFFQGGQLAAINLESGAALLAARQVFYFRCFLHC